MGSAHLIRPLVVALALVSCTQPPAPDADLTGPLTALPACEDPPAPGAAVPEGMATPPGAVLLTVTEQGAMVSASGYVQLTPIQVRLDYEGRDSLDVLHSEDEVFESELLVSDGVRRTFVRASAICDRGSNLLLVVAPESDAERLPEPRYGSWMRWTPWPKVAAVTVPDPWW